MISPAGFCANPQTAASNAFQVASPPGTDLQADAEREFEALLDALGAALALWLTSEVERGRVFIVIGAALAAVGLDAITGQLRLTFGFTELLTGFDFLIAVIGLLTIASGLLVTARMPETLRSRGGTAYT
jgi:TctA family transporter